MTGKTTILFVILTLAMLIVAFASYHMLSKIFGKNKRSNIILEYSSNPVPEKKQTDSILPYVLIAGVVIGMNFFVFIII